MTPSGYYTRCSKYPKVCLRCRKKFLAKNNKALFCSPKCKKENQYQKYREHYKNKSKQYYEGNKIEIRKSAKKVNLQLKLEVFIHYSGSPPKCACCGETIIEFLTIDHIHGGGRKHLQKIGRYGTGFYRWLKQNNYPEGYQVLCMNCNFGKRINNGVCPHGILVYE